MLCTAFYLVVFLPFDSHNQPDLLRYHNTYQSGHLETLLHPLSLVARKLGSA